MCRIGPGETVRRLQGQRIDRQGVVAILVAVLLSLSLGVVIYWRDWAGSLSGAPVCVEDYLGYHFGVRLLIALGSAFLLGFIFSQLFVFSWAALLLPSFVLRNVMCLMEQGMTNLWPPVFVFDMGGVAVALLLSYFGMRARRMLQKPG